MKRIVLLLAVLACGFSPARAGFFGGLEMGMVQPQVEKLLAEIDGVVPPKQETAFGSETVPMQFMLSRPYPGLGGPSRILMGFDAKGGLSVLTLESTEMFPDTKFDTNFLSRYKRFAMSQQQRFGEPVSMRMWPKIGEVKTGSIMYYHVFKASPKLYVYTGAARNEEGQLSLALRFVAAKEVPSLPPSPDAKVKAYWAEAPAYLDWAEADEYILKANNALAGKQPREALEYFKQAAELNSARGYWGMAFLYAGNRGVPSNSELRKEYTEKAARMGYALSMVEFGNNALVASKKLGISIEEVKKIIAEMHLAADEGVFSAQYNLGVMYRNGYGVAKDPEKAKKYLRMAAAKGDRQAETLLASMK